MQLSYEIEKAKGLGEPERGQIHDLIDVYNSHAAANTIKERYYDGHVTLSEVNIGIALPQGMAGLEIGCEWGAKAVDILAGRSMFDGFVSSSGQDAEIMTRIMQANHLRDQYNKACRDELKFGSAFATLSADDRIGCRIRYHSPKTASALWSGAKGRIDCGLAIIDTARDESLASAWQPSIVNLYTDTDIWVIHKNRGVWQAERHPHQMGRPLMEPMAYNATTGKPFGRSRLKKPVRELINGYVRTVANATIGLEFATSPQKYLLGVTDEQFDAVVNQKFQQYIGSILTATPNPETGNVPQFGQLAQGTIEPHVQMIRILATQFSAATGLTVTDVGVINDANPTSSDAILAQSQALVCMAEQLNVGNGNALYAIAQMAQAIALDVTPDELPEEQRNIMAHFKNPAMPSVSVTADAAIKIASARQGFADTDTFLEMIGFDQADIRRIRAEETLSRGRSVLNEVFSDAGI